MQIVVVALIVIGALLPFAGAVWWIIYELSRKEKFFAPRPVEGRGSAVMLEGDLYDFIGRLRGYHFNSPRKPELFDESHPAWEVLPNNGDDTKYADPWFTRLTGILWIGIFTTIREYPFSWIEERKGTLGDPWPRNLPTKIFYMAPFPYMIIVAQAEDRETFKLDLKFIVDIQITNPYIALFANADWLTRVTGEIRSVVRSWVGGTTYQAIVAEKATGTVGITLEIMNLNNELVSEPPPPTPVGGVPATLPLPKGTPGFIGVKIVGCNFLDVNLADERLSGAVTANKVAELEGNANITKETKGAEAARQKAQGEADASRIVARGGADAIRSLNEAVLAAGDKGVVLEQLRAMSAFGKAGGHLVWAPGVDSALANLFRLGFTPAQVATQLEQTGDQP